MTSRRFGFGASVVLLCGMGASGFVGAGCSDSGTPEDEQMAEVAQAIGSSKFECADGDKAPGNSSGAIDWNNAPAMLGPAAAPPPKADKASGGTDDAFGGGAKENDSSPGVVQGGIPSNKSELTRFGVANEVINGQAFLYLFWERSNVIGSANIDFELNQSATPGSNGVTPKRTVGDLLITFDFTNGGTVPVIGARKWSGTSWQAPSTPPVAEAKISSDLKFGETGINLSASGLIPSGACVTLGSAFVKSRSSASFTAELKDFIAPEQVHVSLCNDTEIVVNKVDEGGNPLAGATFQLFKDMNGNGTFDPGTDVQKGSDCTTSLPDASCSFTVTAPPPGSPNDTYIIHESVVPAGYAGGMDQTVTVNAGAPLQKLTKKFINTRLAGIVSIQKRDDAGNPVGDITFTATPAGGGVSSSCKTDVLGACAMTVAPGDYVIDEVVPDSSYVQKGSSLPQTVTVQSNQTTTFTATNPRKFRVVTIVCREGATPDGVTLESHSVTFNGTTLQSIAAPPGSCSVADLCNAGASFGSLPAGTDASTLDVSVALPSVP